MRATVALDDELIRKAQELSGVTERTALRPGCFEGIDSP